MKIAERFETEGDNLHIIQTHDFTPTLERNRELRLNGKGRFGDSEAIGSFPAELVSQWLREAGLPWSAPREEVRQLLVRKLLDPDNAAFLISDRARP